MLPRPTRTILSVIVLTLAMGLPGDARAETLRSMLTKGNQLFAAGEYEAAHEVFKKGYERSPTPVFLRSMAFCLLKLYRHADAQALLQQYVAKYPKAQDLSNIRKALGDLDVVVATTLRVRSTPPGADLYIDAEAAGKVATTPYDGTIDPGTHTIILIAPGYEPTRRTITVEPRKPTDLAITLDIPLKVQSDPPGATVHLDSAEAPSLGTTPLGGGIPPGRHVLFIKRAGFKTFEASVIAAAGKAVEIATSLGVGLRVASTPPGASVLIDGKPQPGVTPLEIAPPPGARRISVEMAGFKTLERTVRVQSGVDSSFSASLEGGMLTMRTDVAGARVRVGDLQVGETPLDRAPVPMGNQQVTLEHPDRRTWNRALDFSDSQMLSAQVRMGRAAWPLWTMLAVSGAALVTGAIIGGVAIAQRSDANDQPVFNSDKEQVGTGYCTSDGDIANYGQTSVFAENGTPIADVANCSYALHHTSTALLSVGAAGLIGSAIYYFFFMRPKETISRENRLQAVSAAKPRVQPRL